MKRAREIKELKKTHPELVPPVKPASPGVVQYEKIKKEFREQFKAKFGEKFGHLTDKMFMLADGYDIIVAREWEYKNGERHRIGSWYHVEKPKEIIELMNGMDQGEEDSYYKIVTQKPNVEMLKYISDQLMGRAPQKLKVDHSLQFSDILKNIRERNKGVVEERKSNAQIYIEAPKQIIPKEDSIKYEEYIDE